MRRIKEWRSLEKKKNNFLMSFELTLTSMGKNGSGFFFFFLRRNKQKKGKQQTSGRIEGNAFCEDKPLFSILS